MRLRRRGFTLIELMIVVTLIAILAAFILKAAFGGIRRAEEKATLALIAKLEAGMTDRIDALASQHPAPTGAHYALAQLYNSNVVFHQPASQRAQVIASYDYLRAELPDVFVVINAIPQSGNPPKGVYLMNFAAAPFGSAGDATDYILPLGANGQYAPLLQPPPAGNPALAATIGITAQNSTPTSLGGGLSPTGWYGASFAAAAAIHKQLGYSEIGTNGADDNGDGFIDDLLEGVQGLQPGEQLAMSQRLARHTHKTARAEMLYAILIEGTGPLGSVFLRDDFNDQEVKDTDGDGLMEFVDAWGEPLQFFRWPILYRSDVQKGFPDLAKVTQDLAAGFKPGPYASVYEARDVDPLDPNQQLLAPAWWTSSYNTGPGWTASSGNVSGAAMAFQAHFHTLVDPLAVSAGAPSNNTFWDRSITATVRLQIPSGGSIDVSYYPRRAYYSRFLILSGGPDKIAGVAQLGVDYRAIDDRSQFPLSDGSYASTRDGSGAAVPLLGPAANPAQNVIQIENQGGQVDPNRSGAFAVPSFSGSYRNDTSTFLKDYASQDDITSQNLNSAGGPLQ